MENPGFFVTFEGIDGTGKTTQFNLLAKWMPTLGIEVVRAKEPGDIVDGAYIGSELGKHVRQILFFSEVNTATGLLDEEARDLLFLADHIQLYRRTIVPALRQGKTVLCDRYGDSQLAYGAGKDGSPWIDELYMQRFGPVPDATILMIGDPTFLSGRAKGRKGTEEGKQDGKSWASDEGQKVIRDKYLENLLYEPRTIVINVTPEKGIGEVHAEITSKLYDLMNDKTQGLPPSASRHAWQLAQQDQFGTKATQMTLFPDGVREGAVG